MAKATTAEQPMPPHVTFEQAKAFTASVAAAPRAGIAGAAEGVHEMVHELMHGERR